MFPPFGRSEKKSCKCIVRINENGYNSLHQSGRGAVRLARLHGVQEVGGSNPLAPTNPLKSEFLFGRSYPHRGTGKSFRPQYVGCVHNAPFSPSRDRQILSPAICRVRSQLTIFTSEGRANPLSSRGTLRPKDLSLGFQSKILHFIQNDIKISSQRTIFPIGGQAIPLAFLSS